MELLVGLIPFDIRGSHRNVADGDLGLSAYAGLTSPILAYGHRHDSTACRRPFRLSPSVSNVGLQHNTCFQYFAHLSYGCGPDGLVLSRALKHD